MLGFIKTPRRMEDLALFARHVAGSMSARVPLPDILRAYLKDCERGRLAKAVEKMAERVESGVKLSEAMEEHTDVFPEVVRRLVWLGEEGRSLAGVMDQLADTLEEGLKTYEQTRRAAIYPLMVILVLFTILTGITLFISPQFQKIFLDLGVGNVYGSLGEFLGFNIAWNHVFFGMNLLLIIPIVFLLAAILGLKIRGFGSGRFLLQFPLVGPVIRMAETARFAHYLSLLTANKIPMAESLALLAEATPNTYVRWAIQDLQQRYESGERLGDLLSSQPLFPASMAVMVAAAEDQGGLAETLRKLARFYNERTLHGLTVLREVFEPIMLILIGILVALALALIYMPLFELPSRIGLLIGLPTLIG